MEKRTLKKDTPFRVLTGIAGAVEVKTSEDQGEYAVVTIATQMPPADDDPKFHLFREDFLETAWWPPRVGDAVTVSIPMIVELRRR